MGPLLADNDVYWNFCTVMWLLLISIHQISLKTEQAPNFIHRSFPQSDSSVVVPGEGPLTFNGACSTQRRQCAARDFLGKKCRVSFFVCLFLFLSHVSVAVDSFNTVVGISAYAGYILQDS